MRFTRNRIAGRLVDDDYGIGVQLLPWGDVVYLAGKPKDRLTMDADGVPDDPVHRLGREAREALAGEGFVSGVLLNADFHESVDLRLDTARHVASLRLLTRLSRVTGAPYTRPVRL